jgi:hypothetical protein
MVSDNQPPLLLILWVASLKSKSQSLWYWCVMVDWDNPSFFLMTHFQILIALEEWSSGQLVAFRTLVTIANTISQRIQELVPKVRAFKEGRPTAWRNFCHCVHIGPVNQSDSLVHPLPLAYLSTGIDDIYTVEMESQGSLNVTD